MELGDWARCFSFILLAFSALSYVGYSLRKRTEMFWHELAAANNLTYAPGLFFLGQSGFVTGIYRGYYLELETGTSTRITLSAHNPTNSRRIAREIGLMVESLLAAEPLRVFTVSHQLQGQIKGGPDPVIVRYERDGGETDTAYLQSTFDLLGDMADVIVLPWLWKVRRFLFWKRLLETIRMNCNL